MHCPNPADWFSRQFDIRLIADSGGSSRTGILQSAIRYGEPIMPLAAS
ncbi:hypothetical protein [Nitrosospira sp. Nl5]|nr:hypothetical protein [Nitrosospira sp. Nl5]